MSTQQPVCTYQNMDRNSSRCSASCHRESVYTYQNMDRNVHHYGMQHYLSTSDQRELPDEKKAIVPIELAQVGNDEFVPIEMALIPNVRSDGTYGLGLMVHDSRL